jgi:DNA-binding IclR family transcriptional regulator
LPEATVAPFVARELEEAKLRPKTESGSGKSLETLRAEVRRRGIGRGIGEETSSVAVLAAPVFGANGRLALSIGLISAIGGFDTSYKGEPAMALKRTAAELSRRLGFSGGDEA